MQQPYTTHAGAERSCAHQHTYVRCLGVRVRRRPEHTGPFGGSTVAQQQYNALVSVTTSSGTWRKRQTCSLLLLLRPAWLGPDVGPTTLEEARAWSLTPPRVPLFRRHRASTTSPSLRACVHKSKQGSFFAHMPVREQKWTPRDAFLAAGASNGQPTTGRRRDSGPWPAAART
ncbi:hypothetical protein RJ55_08483 [Drechmeria coniospora]|nr:hypothetical protein RJ55_08483 [Drechmeria coniospora]